MDDSFYEDELVAWSRRQLLEELHAADELGLYTTPIRPREMGIPHYTSVIKHPVDLETIERRIEGGAFPVWHGGDRAFYDEVGRVYANGLRFFAYGSRAHTLARKLLEHTEKARQVFLRRRIAAIKREEDDVRECKKAHDKLTAHLMKVHALPAPTVVKAKPVLKPLSYTEKLRIVNHLRTETLSADRMTKLILMMRAHDPKSARVFKGDVDFDFGRLDVKTEHAVHKFIFAAKPAVPPIKRVKHNSL